MLITPEYFAVIMGGIVAFGVWFLGRNDTKRLQQKLRDQREAREREAREKADRTA